MRGRIRANAARVVVAAILLVQIVGGGARTEQPAAAAVVAAPTFSYGQRSGLAPGPGGCGAPDLATVAASLTRVVAAGVKMIRCDLSWWTVQPTGPDVWNWTDFDNVVTASSYLGLQVLFIPAFTPPWARPNPLPAGTGNGSHVPPVHLSDYVTFVHEAVQRYAPNGPKRPATLAGSVSMWEIWNEPNLVGFWNPVDPVRYSAFLTAAAVAIKWVDPWALVISGGLAPAGNNSGNIAPDTFTYVLALTGALNVVDGVGIHPYTFPAYPSERINFNPLMNHVPRMYNVLKTFGYGSKKIWATEAGWPTSSQSTDTTRFDGSQVGTEPVQALAMWDLVTTWYKAPYAGPLFLYQQRDRCTNLANWLCMMGLERFDGTRKPAFGVVSSIMSMPSP